MDVIDFLTDEFQAGRQYSTLNSYRSALSSTLPPLEGFAIGQHPLVVKLLQGMFNSRPPQPRYTSIWQVRDVLDHIKGHLHDNGSLPLRDLTRKLVTLLALATASRASDLHLLDIRFMTFYENRVEFTLAGLTKTRRSGPPKVSSIRTFPSDPGLCPVKALREYLNKTSSLRHPNPQRLLISWRKPYKPVSSSTVARWIKSVLKESGIDVGVFKAHSTRAAATSAARARGASVADVMKMAGWSRASTFETYYHKQVVNDGGVSLEDTWSTGQCL